VVFYRDSSVLVGTDTASPYSMSFSTTSLANGSHTFLAKAYDAANNVKSSATVTVTLITPTPPRRAFRLAQPAAARSAQPSL
jgi:hypothetical protein